MTAVGGGTVLRWAGATDVGNVRSNNEDRYLLRPQQRLCVVADGMGGHRGGEVASEIACETVARTYSQNTVDSLVEAINAANTAVYEAGTSDPDLAGMGTTVVSLAVVADDEAARTDSDRSEPGDVPPGEMLAVANVGDSRAYRLTEGQLQQLTEDHSLVADMVREGSISREEAESHPQKNIVTRALGVYDDVPVDVFTMSPRPGDRYLLCTDGLSDEVTMDRMAAVLSRLTDAEEAADELVRMAVEAGARDNVTVVVVDVVDGDADPRTEAGDASALAGGPMDSSELRPITGHAYAEGEEYRPYRLRDDGADTDEETPPPKPGRRRRRLTWRVAGFLLLVLAVVGGAVATIQWYGRSTYFVGFSGDEVVIYQGRPGGVLWVQPELVEESTLQRDDVPRDAIARLESGLEHSSLDDAEAYVTRLEERAEELRNPS